MEVEDDVKILNERQERNSNKSQIAPINGLIKQNQASNFTHKMKFTNVDENTICRKKVKVSLYQLRSKHLRSTIFKRKHKLKHSNVALLCRQLYNIERKTIQKEQDKCDQLSMLDSQTGINSPYSKDTCSLLRAEKMYSSLFSKVENADPRIDHRTQSANNLQTEGSSSPKILTDSDRSSISIKTSSGIQSIATRAVKIPRRLSTPVSSKSSSEKIGQVNTAKREAEITEESHLQSLFFKTLPTVLSPLPVSVADEKEQINSQLSVAAECVDISQENVEKLPIVRSVSSTVDDKLASNISAAEISPLKTISTPALSAAAVPYLMSPLKCADDSDSHGLVIQHVESVASPPCIDLDTDAILPTAHNIQPIVVKNNSEPITVEDNIEPVVVKDDIPTIVEKDKIEPIAEDNIEPIVVKQNIHPPVVKKDIQPILVEDEVETMVVEDAREIMAVAEDTACDIKSDATKHSKLSNAKDDQVMDALLLSDSATDSMGTLTPPNMCAEPPGSPQSDQSDCIIIEKVESISAANAQAMMCESDLMWDNDISPANFLQCDMEVTDDLENYPIDNYHDEKLLMTPIVLVGQTRHTDISDMFAYHHKIGACSQYYCKSLLRKMDANPKKCKVKRTVLHLRKDRALLKTLEINRYMASTPVGIRSYTRRHKDYVSTAATIPKMASVNTGSLGGVTNSPSSDYNTSKGLRVVRKNGGDVPKVDVCSKDMLTGKIIEPKTEVLNPTIRRGRRPKPTPEKPSRPVFIRAKPLSALMEPQTVDVTKEADSLPTTNTILPTSTIGGGPSGLPMQAIPLPIAQSLNLIGTPVASTNHEPGGSSQAMPTVSTYSLSHSIFGSLVDSGKGDDGNATNDVAIVTTYPPQGPPQSYGTNLCSTPQFQGSSAPQFQASSVPQFQASTAPQFQVSTAPQFQASTTPQFQASAAPQFQASTVPQFQASTAPQFQASTAPQFQATSMPHFVTGTYQQSSQCANIPNDAQPVLQMGNTFSPNIAGQHFTSGALILRPTDAAAGQVQPTVVGSERPLLLLQQPYIPVLGGGIRPNYNAEEECKSVKLACSGGHNSTYSRALGVCTLLKKMKEIGYPDNGGALQNIAYQLLVSYGACCLKQALTDVNSGRFRGMAYIPEKEPALQRPTVPSVQKVILKFIPHYKMFILKRFTFAVDIETRRVLFPLPPYCHPKSTKNIDKMTVLMLVSPSEGFGPGLVVMPHTVMTEDMRNCFNGEPCLKDWGLSGHSSGGLTRTIVTDYLTDVALPWIMKVKSNQWENYLLVDKWWAVDKLVIPPEFTGFHTFGLHQMYRANYDPLDVFFNLTMQRLWGVLVRKWTKDQTCLTENVFPKFFMQSIRHLYSNNHIADFCAQTGLYPIDMNRAFCFTQQNLTDQAST